MKRNVYNSAASQGLTSLHSNFTWVGSSPSNYSWRQKTRDTGLPDGEDHITLRSLVVTQYWSVTDGRTDRQKDGFAVAYTASSFAEMEHCRNCRISEMISCCIIKSVT